MPRRRASVQGEGNSSDGELGADNKKGFLSIVGVGIGFDPDEDESLTAKFNLVFAYDIQGVASIGIGTGVRAVPKRESLVLPVYLDLRIAFLKTNISPYIGVAGGPAWILNKNTGNGASDAFIHAEIGVQIKQSTQSAIQIGLSFEEIPVYKPPSTSDLIYQPYGSLSTLSTFGVEVTFVF